MSSSWSLATRQRERFEIELASQHRSQTQRFLGLGGQYPHPRLNGHPHTLGNAQFFRAGSVPAPVLVGQLSAFHQRLAHFFDVKGITFGFAVDAVQEFGGDLLGKQDGQHLFGLFTVQPG